MSNKDKVGLGLVCIETIGLVVGAIWCYGQSKFYDGRISKSKELMPILESLNNELKRMNSKG